MLINKRTFICAGKVYNDRKKYVAAPVFRKIFDWEYGAQAKLEIGVVGFYRLFLNGKELTKGWFAPYVSNPDQYVYYDEYEIGQYLKRKENILCVLLGNGFGNSIDFNVWDFEKAAFRGAPKLYLGLYAKEKRVLTSDESFEVSDSAIIFDDLRAGERYDARLEEDFNSPAYQGRNRRSAIVADTPKGKYKKSEAQVIKEFQRLRPVSIRKSKRGYIYDFGVNDAGVYKLRINAKAGQTIHMFFGEVLQDGELDRNNISFPPRTDLEYIQHDVYVCKDGEQEYIPSFTYHGYRYVCIEGLDERQATKDTLTFIVLHSDIPQIGKFSCSHETINKIQECILRSDLSNFYYFPTDCPHREKNGWSDDAGISAEQINYNFDAYDSYRVWFENIRASQKADGQLPGIIPTSGWGYHWGNGPLSDIFIFELPYQIYRFTGKKEIIQENSDMMLRYIDYMYTKIREDGLVGYGLEDWCEAGNDEKHKCATPLEVTDTLLCVAILRLATKLLQTIDRTERLAEFKEVEERLLASFKRSFIQEKGWVSCKSQTGQAMAIALGVFEGEEEKLAYRNLLTILKNYGNRMHIGVTGSKFLFDVLSDHGDAELAFHLIADPAWPSYGYLISMGATTLWETFQHFKFVNGEYKPIGEKRIVSLNHHFWGSVSAWFYRVLAGLNVVSAEEIFIHPQIVKFLSFAEAEFGREGRKIFTRWERKGEDVMLFLDNSGYHGRISIEGYVCGGERFLPLKDGKQSYLFKKIND